jgi:hypothetical protein
MGKTEVRTEKYMSSSLAASITLMLIITELALQGAMNFTLVNVFGQQNNSDTMPSGQLTIDGAEGMEHGGQGQGMSGMDGMMEHGGQGQGMSGMDGMMSGMMEHGAPGGINEMCHMGDDMPPHYCEPSYHVMSSVKGVKITDVAVVNDTAIVLTLRELNPMSNNTVDDIVIVGGGGDLAGSTLLNGNWKESATATINLVGTGSVYSTDRLMIHLFPFNGQP